MNCENCYIGRYRPITTAYLQRLGDRMLVVPKAPALVCDVCKETHYDPCFLESISYLLDRLAADPATPVTDPHRLIKAVSINS